MRAYNDTVGSLESRVLVTARRFSELAVTRGTLEEVEQVDRRARVPGAPELTGEGDGTGLAGRAMEPDVEEGGMRTRRAVSTRVGRGCIG